MNPLNHHWLVATGAALLLSLTASCADDDLTDPSAKSDVPITVRAEVSDVWLPGEPSRGAAEAPRPVARLERGFKVDGNGQGRPLYVFEEVSDRFTGREAPPETPSRGSKILDGGIDDMTIGMTAHCTGEPRADQPFYMLNVPYRKQPSHMWASTEGTYLWPLWNSAEDDLRFFAYAPHNPDCTGASGNPRIAISKNGLDVKMHYKVPDAMPDQLDLLVTPLTVPTDIGDARRNGLKMTFHHALTSVRFVNRAADHSHSVKKGMYPGTVTNVTIRNIAGEGVYDIVTGQWVENPEGTGLRDFSFDCNSSISEYFQGDNTTEFVSAENNILTDANNTLMMIPQNSSRRDGPKPVIDIAFRDAATGTLRHFTKELDIDWQAGKSVCYYISTSEMHTQYYFDVEVKGGKIEGTPEAETADPARVIKVAGNEKLTADLQPEVKVTSYFEVYQLIDDKVVNIGRAPARWKTEVEVANPNGGNATFYPAENVAEWKTTLKDFHGSNTIGGPLTRTLPLVVGPIENFSTSTTEDVSLNPVLPGCDEMLGGEKVCDLSRYNIDKTALGPANSANSYVIDGPGVYKIPLVYGNAIKNGEPNPAAYTCSQPGALQQFLRPDGMPITDPWICNNVTSTGNWSLAIERCQTIGAHNADKMEAMESLMEVLKFSDDKKYLYFRIYGSHEKMKLQPGNVVFSVNDAQGNVLWHWHLWITAEFKKQADDFTLGQYRMMRYTLGQLNGDEAIYEPRTLRIKITQLNSAATPSAPGNSRILEFHQEGFVIKEFDQALYYQNGRMDPVYAFLRRLSFDENSNAVYGNYHRVFNSKKNENVTLVTVRPAASIPYVLRNPIYIYDTGHEVFTTPYSNLWNNGTETNPVKTVYDPSPPGYMVPATYPDGWLSNKISFSTHDFCIRIDGIDGVAFPKGVLGIGDPAADAQSQISHNHQYTCFWTSTKGFSFRFNKPTNTETPDNPPTINTSSPLVTHGSIRPAYLLMVRPVRE